MSKTTLIKPLDLVTFGAPALIASGLTIYSYTQGVSGEPLALLIAMSVVFVAIYVALVVWRYKFISRISFTTKHGLHIIGNGFPVTKEKIEALTEHTLRSWDGVLYPLTCQDWLKLGGKAINELIVSFEEFPIQHSTMGKLAGFAVGDNVVVGFKDPLDSTAFEHELGHYIYKKYTGTFENENCHAFMKENGLK